MDRRSDRKRKGSLLVTTIGFKVWRTFLVSDEGLVHVGGTLVVYKMEEIE